MTPTLTKRFTLDEYHRLTEIGFFTPDDRIELIHGELVPTMTKGKPHSVCCQNLLEELAGLIRGIAKLRCQDPITLLPNSETEPDFAIIRLRDDQYLSSHPQPEDIYLVIEISDSTLEYDRQVKLPLYAEAGIRHYWIVNLLEGCLETYQQPFQNRQAKFDYALKQVFLPESRVLLPELTNLELDLTKIFPLRH